MSPWGADARDCRAAASRAGLLTRVQADIILKGKHKGFVVGKYKILDLLGAGGMGRVYLCEHTGMGHRVAMKVLPPDAEQSSVTVARFLRAARAAARLNHPNIVRAYDLDHANGHPFIIMEYVDGLTLDAVSQRFAPLDTGRAANYAAQTASGLAHIAAAGPTHRDIKPANLILDETGRVPFEGLSFAQKLACHQSKEPAWVGELRPDAPPGLIAVVEKLMAKCPSARYATPGEVVEALREWAEPAPVPLALKPESGGTARPLSTTVSARLAAREPVSARLPSLVPSSRTVPSPSLRPAPQPSSGRFRIPIADVLAEVIRAAQSGRRVAAQQLLAEVTAHDPDNETVCTSAASAPGARRGRLPDAAIPARGTARGTRGEVTARSAPPCSSRADCYSSRDAY